MILTGAKVFEKEGRFTERELFTAGERICSRQEAEDQEVVDAGGRYAVPMLVDLHFHGCSGVDFCDGTEEAIQTIADYQLRNGIGAICPATMTYPEEKLGKIADAAASHRNGRGADLVGIHMEGPFINIQKKAPRTALMCISRMRKCFTGSRRGRTDSSSSAILRRRWREPWIRFGSCRPIPSSPWRIPARITRRPGKRSGRGPAT